MAAAADLVVATVATVAAVAKVAKVHLEAQIGQAIAALAHSHARLGWRECVRCW